MNVAATWWRDNRDSFPRRFHDIDGGLTKRARHCALDYTNFTQANASAGACQEQANGIGQHLQYDNPPWVGNFDTCLFGLNGIGENFRDFLVA